MLNIKGFAAIPSLADNANNATAIIGELSPMSQTFSKNVTVHTHPTIDTSLVELRSFSVIDTINGPTALPTPAAGNIVDILNWLYNEATANALGNSAAVIESNLSAEYSTLIDIAMGPLIVIGTYAIPEWVTWTQTDATKPYITKVWFSDAAFLGQYDETELIVIPPIDNIDVLFGTFTTINSLISAVSGSNLVTKIVTASGNIPYSTLKTMDITWKNPNNPLQTITTEWTVIVYGLAGSSIDRLREAVIAYILAHTTHTRAEWEVLLPFLFISTEYIITPHWDRLGIPNQTLQAGMYSAITTPGQITNHALITKHDYLESFVRTAVRGSFATYKSIAFSIVGNVDNIDGIYTLEGRFPDYTPIPTTSPDFSRMALRTQQWAVMLNELLILAESATLFSSLPMNVSRIHRNGIMFICKSFENVLYLVMAKSYYN